MRGATRYMLIIISQSEISIHAPHAGRDVGVVYGNVIEAISIHAPHAGRD